MTDWLWLFGKIGVVIGIFMSLAGVMTLVERRVSAFIQGRVGPNRVGPMGALQPLADIIKFMMKEDIIPEEADPWLFIPAPLIVFLPSALGFAVIPFGSRIGDQQLQVANLPIGILFVMSVLSVGVYGIALGGWASNNKYSLLGSLRASAQLISYELTLGLTILLVVMMTGSIDMQEIVRQQVETGWWNVFGGGSIWRLPSGILAFGMFYICALAENNRLPFDMAECESELVGGYHTEYSAFKFAMFMLAEYVAMILMSSLMVTLFLGAWHLPFLGDFLGGGTWLGGILSIGVFLAKVSVLLFTYVWVRWTLPRFKYDQLMDLGWKAFLPISLANIAVVAIVGVFLEG